MPRLRTIALAVVVILVTDVMGDGKALSISFGWPGRKPIASFALPWTAFVIESALRSRPIH